MSWGGETPRSRAAARRTSASSSAPPRTSCSAPRPSSIVSQHLVFSGSSFLESRSVSTATLRDYYRRAKDFQKWAAAHYVQPFLLPTLMGGHHFLRESGRHRYDGPRPILLIDPVYLDELITIFFDALFMQKRPAAQGEKLIAALIFFFPKLTKATGAPLARAARGLRGWRRAVPAQSRLPLPMAALLAIVDELLISQWELAVATLLAFHCYLRPCEVEPLVPMQVVSALDPLGSGRPKVGLVLAPMELRKPSKTGHWDEAVLIDRCDALLGPLLTLKKKAMAEGSPLFSFRRGSMTPAIRRAADDLGLAEFSVTAYSLRHGGASHDLLCQMRPLQEIKRRGRWASDSCLRRYSKETRLIEVMQRVPLATVQRASRLQARLAPTLFACMPPHIAAYRD